MAIPRHRTSSNRRAAIIGACAALLMGSAACRDATAPALPPGAVALELPSEFALWWEMTRSCAERTAELGSIDWYYIPGAATIQVSGVEYHGYWWSRGNRIVLAEGALRRPRLVRHEMLHALTGAGHSRAVFGGDCLGIVSCDRECADDIGRSPAIPDDAPEIDASGLQLFAVMVPAAVSKQQHDGWFAITVSAVNPRPQAVWVRLDRLHEGHLAAATFTYEVDGFQRDYLWTFDERIGFAPFETKRFTFDFNVNNRDPHQLLRSERHAIQTFFNSALAGSHDIVVSP